MIESFRFLTDAESAAARAAVPTPLPPRTPEQVADGVAAAFTAKEADALAGFLSACVATAAEQAGGVTVSRETYVSGLRAAFAGGLVVTVRPRPFEAVPASEILTVEATWQDARGTRERKLMLRRGENDRWEMLGTLCRCDVTATVPTRGRRRFALLTPAQSLPISSGPRWARSFPGSRGALAVAAPSARGGATRPA